MPDSSLLFEDIGVRCLSSPWFLPRTRPSLRCEAWKTCWGTAHSGLSKGDPAGRVHGLQLAGDHRGDFVKAATGLVVERNVPRTSSRTV